MQFIDLKRQYLKFKSEIDQQIEKVRLAPEIDLKELELIIFHKEESQIIESI